MLKIMARECGACTACCGGWLNIEVEQETIHTGSPCSRCSNQGCGNYENRPQVCSDFKCLWLDSDNRLPVWMRPDRAKVIVKFLDWLGKDQPLIISALPVGRRIPPRSLEILKKLSLALNSPLVYLEYIKDKKGRYSDQIKVSGFGPPNMQYAFKKIQNRVENIPNMSGH